MTDNVWCPRCRGLMVWCRFTDLPCEAERMVGPIWRCVSCGEVVDSVILRNRHGRPPRRGRPATRRFAAMISGA